MRADLGTTWAPVGRPPVLTRVSQRREVASSGALVAPLDGPARLYAGHFVGSVRGEQVIVALRSFRRRVGRPRVVGWDRLNAHRAGPVLAFVAAHPHDYRLEWLPPYSPDLTPEELGNGAVKRDMLTAAPDSVEALRASARCRFRRLARQPDLLRGFFRHAGLRVN